MSPCDRFPAYADVVGRTKTQPNGALMDEQLDIDLAVLTIQSEHEYHAKAGEYLTSHLLADFRKCPLLYAKRLEGLAERRDTPAYTLVRRTLAMAAPRAGLEGSIYAGLERLTERLLGKEWRRDDGALVRIDRCLIDANWGQCTDLVYRFCRQSRFANVLLPAHGRYVGAAATFGFDPVFGR